MQRIKLPQIQGHYLTLTLNSPILALEIEEESSGRTFSLDLDEDSISQVTDGLFPTAEDLFRGLQDGANYACPGITLSLSNGKLTYTVVFKIEEIQRHSFTLNLAEKRVDQVEILERKLKLLEEWKEKHEGETLKDKKNLQKLQQKANEIEDLQNEFQSFKMLQKLGKLEARDSRMKVSVFKPDISFNFSSCEASMFNFTDNYKTATSNYSSDYCSGDYCYLDIFPQISSSGKYSYTVRINPGCQSIYFGIKSNTGPPMKNDLNYYFSVQYGVISGVKSVKHPTQECSLEGKDGIIKMIVDMDQTTLTFFVDNRQINSCNIEKLDRYSAYLNFTYSGDSVTLFEFDRN